MKHLEFGSQNSETIVFLHGGNVAGWMWGQQVPAFEQYHVVVPDLPGFGASNDLPWVSIADAADHVAALLAGRPAHVVGLSLGSSVAMYLAARHPQLVSSLFLASAQVSRPFMRDMIAATVLLKFWKQPSFWRTQARSYGLTGDDAEVFVETGLGIRVETARAIYREVRRGVPDAVLDAVRAPTIAVAGERDSSAITGQSLRAIATRIPGSRTAIAPGLHHQWNIENVELFNHSLHAWLSSGDVATGLRAKI